MTIGTVSISTRVTPRRSTNEKGAWRTTSARRAEEVSKDIATSGGFGHSHGIVARATEEKVPVRTVGLAMMDTQVRRTARKARQWQGRHAEGLFWVWVYGARQQELLEEHECPTSGGGRPRNSLHRQSSEQRSTGGMEEDAYMKVILGVS